MSASVRLANLEQLLTDRFGGKIADMARAIERDDAYLWQLLHGSRNVGERTARHIEAKLELPMGALDAHGMAMLESLKPDERELLQHYRKAIGSWKKAIRLLAALEGTIQDEISKNGNALLAKVSAEHASDERDTQANGNGGQSALHEPAATVYRTKAL